MTWKVNVEVFTADEKGLMATARVRLVARSPSDTQRIPLGNDVMHGIASVIYHAISCV